MEELLKDLIKLGNEMYKKINSDVKCELSPDKIMDVVNILYEVLDPEELELLRNEA